MTNTRTGLFPGALPWRPLALAGAILLSPVAPVMAESCLEEVRGLARDYNLAIDPPDLSRDRATSAPASRAPSRLGGVIEPKPGTGAALIEPEGDDAYAMSTIPGGSRRQQRQPGGPDRMSPAQRAMIESMLISARAEARRGREQDCLARLQDAKALIEQQEGAPSRS